MSKKKLPVSTDSTARNRIALSKFTEPKIKYGIVVNLQMQGNEIFALCREADKEPGKARYIGHESTTIPEEELVLGELLIETDIKAYYPMPGGFNTFLGNIVKIEYRGGRPSKVLLTSSVSSRNSRVISAVDLTAARNTNRDLSLKHIKAKGFLMKRGYSKEQIEIVINEKIEVSDGKMIGSPVASWIYSSEDSIGEAFIVKETSHITGLPNKELKGRTCHYHAKGIGG